ncbi:MAG: type II toxin-antitoxin system HicA family toxin [Lachnospiraceae bacterium]|nr:type II toxin-antitoxin system HicA family toxin [Lachnospiraceae bacterium]
MSGKDLVKRLQKDGWTIARIEGSHHIMKKENKTVAIPVHGNKDIPKGLLNKILKETGLT